MLRALRVAGYGAWRAQCLPESSGRGPVDPTTVGLGAWPWRPAAGPGRALRKRAEDAFVDATVRASCACLSSWFIRKPFHDMALLVGRSTLRVGRGGMAAAAGAQALLAWDHCLA